MLKKMSHFFFYFLVVALIPFSNSMHLAT